MLDRINDIFERLIHVTQDGCITTEWQKGDKSGKAEAKRADQREGQQ